ncbi:MAG: ATP-binding cassette domain-containing protein [Acidobacteriaceae bacterium]|nr:ATP-binding cassette domain-containing protein [Acidobacteriaceae bacterium]
MRRFLAPEVVQTSNMDCGPASLKCLLDGFGIPVSYGRLREACQTGIDGTSIDTMEVVANQLGLEAQQIMLPVDHLLLREAQALPALVVVQLPNGMTHFVIVWRRHGPLLQVMDPAVGRRWIPARQFAADVFRHSIAVSATDWREFAASDSFQSALSARLRGIGIPPGQTKRLCSYALDQPGWQALAILDASTRFLTSLLQAGGVSRGQKCARLVEYFCNKPALIPERSWSVQEASPDPDGTEQVLMAGAVLVRARRKRVLATKAESSELPPELAAALAEPTVHPARELLQALWKSGWVGCGLLLTAVLVAGGGVAFEAMLFRVLLSATSELGLAGQRLGAMVAVLVFSVALLLLELPGFALCLRIGRQVETRLRIAFLEKIPKLGDRYFRSRLTSDMAERSHATHRLRQLPDQFRQLLRALCEFCATAAGIIWLDPSLAMIVVAVAACVSLPAFATQSFLSERDLRVRSHTGALTRFYLDAMLGLFAIRSHGAERSVRREQEKLLGEWTHAALRLQRAVVSLEAIQLTAVFGLIAALLLSHPLHGLEIGRLLLLVYWALNLPVLAHDITTLARQYPFYRNVTLRLLDPLGAAEEGQTETDLNLFQADAAPSLAFREVFAQVSGHMILERINLEIEAGTHVALVGPSGAGKSSLVGLLLGWLTASSGSVLVNGTLLNCEELRRFTAWVDPAVQLWNRSLAQNLCYGTTADASNLGSAIDTALLRNLLESLPSGLQTPLGEGGALVSGGEGQRVRLGRAMLRSHVRLVILDEPFRGLDREKRKELLARARHYWRDCTLLCITHDLSETAAFDRVLVVEAGTIVDDGAPEELLANPQSRYAQLLAAEEEARSGIWSGNFWRHIRVYSGRVVEELPRSHAEACRETEVA